MRLEIQSQSKFFVHKFKKKEFSRNIFQKNLLIFSLGNAMIWWEIFEFELHLVNATDVINIFYYEEHLPQNCPGVSKDHS